MISPAIALSPCDRTQPCTSPIDVYLPMTSSPRNKPPSTDRKYPTFIVMTANILRSS